MRLLKQNTDTLPELEHSQKEIFHIVSNALYQCFLSVILHKTFDTFHFNNCIINISSVCIKIFLRRLSFFFQMLMRHIGFKAVGFKLFANSLNPLPLRVCSANTCQLSSSIRLHVLLIFLYFRTLNQSCQTSSAIQLLLMVI